ncbi:MAG: LysM peptidoglycan-binding domain-containing protein [Paracoccaceae bacterium]
MARNTQYRSAVVVVLGVVVAAIAYFVLTTQPQTPPTGDAEVVSGGTGSAVSSDTESEPSRSGDATAVQTTGASSGEAADEAGTDQAAGSAGAVATPGTASGKTPQTGAVTDGTADGEADADSDDNAQPQAAEGTVGPTGAAGTPVADDGTETADEVAAARDASPAEDQGAAVAAADTEDTGGEEAPAASGDDAGSAASSEAESPDVSPGDAASPVVAENARAEEETADAEVVSEPAPDEAAAGTATQDSEAMPTAVEPDTVVAGTQDAEEGTPEAGTAEAPEAGTAEPDTVVAGTQDAGEDATEVETAEAPEPAAVEPEAETAGTQDAEEGTPEAGTAETPEVGTAEPDTAVAGAQDAEEGTPKAGTVEAPETATLEPEAKTAGTQVAEEGTPEAGEGAQDTAIAEAPGAEAVPEAPEPTVSAEIAGPGATTGPGDAGEIDQVAGLSRPTVPSAGPRRIAPLAGPGTDNTSAATSVKAPSFDLVRVAPDGGSVIAGRAQPNETVDITADGKVIATTRTNERGEFVAMLTAPESEAPLSLGLIARSDAGEARASTANVLILNARRPDPQTGEVAEEAPIVVREVDDKIEIVQPAKPPIPGQVVIDKIGYDREGDVEISGRGRPRFLVRLYINGKFTEETKIGEGGGWELKLSSVEAGRYTLRVDEVSPDGKVASRTETPFQRIFPELIPDMSENTDGYYTVQPGNNLWTIARNHYGHGIEYWQIFYANETQIRDPDLIYPGQIFVLPDQRGVNE